MTDVQKNLKFLKVAIACFITLIVVAQIWFWFWPKSYAYIAPTNEIVAAYGGLEKLTFAQKAGGFISTALPQFFLVWSLTLLFRLTTLLQNGLWFDEQCELICIRVGKLLFIYIGAHIISHTLLVLSLTANNPPGEKALALQLSSSDLSTLVPALLALIIGHMMRLARIQRDELNAIV